MKKFLIGSLLLAAFSSPACAQRTLSLDSCRALALDHNKQMCISRMKQDVAKNIRKSARTKYLPRVTAAGGYLFTSREISLLSNAQKATLGSIGTTAMSGVGAGLQDFAGNLTTDQLNSLNGALADFNTSVTQLMGDLNGQIGDAATTLNAEGQKLADAFRTDTRNLWAGSVMVTQPLFMGGSIVAFNKLAELGEQLEASALEGTRQQTLYDIDKAYWTVVSLKHKRRLADSFLKLVQRLDSDVQKMVAEGVATRADGLTVSVKVNEAEMTVTQVEDGLTLARMYLCQLCGLPLGEEFTLEDEDAADLQTAPSELLPDTALAAANRPELKMLQTTIDMGKQSANLLKAGNLPQVLLIGGYTTTNPSVYDGFRRRFGGAWNVGVLVRVPVWNWGDVAYKVRAAKGATAIAEMQMADTREKIALQVNQSAFQLNEAHKRMAMAEASTKRAEENLRCADLGFHEGVMPLSTVMEAQTAWLQAQAQKIDAEIDVRLGQVNLNKALGTLQQ